ncbi:MAG TPA: VPLPA-CTERM sorting domain-containing protein [Crenotrichaceae bacterium]|nr:VPLPA-CTERM sorting domain-containing protein [Crenotrichaceae bacterium]
MKKTILSTSIALTLGIVTPHANAAFTPLASDNYTMRITGGCFSFGNCVTLGAGTFSDNTAGQTSITVTVGMPTVRPVGSTIGSGIAGDGIMGVIDFSLDNAGNMIVTSFAQDSYVNTDFPYKKFAIDALDVSGMSGSIDSTGNIIFNPSGREGAYGFSTAFNLQEWNRDKTSQLYDSFTTGTSTNSAGGTSPAFTLNGSALLNDGSGGWTGTIVSAGNLNGDNWTGYNNVQYSEVFNITITSAVPVPAAPWLFGTGLAVLTSVARRKHWHN